MKRGIGEKLFLIALAAGCGAAVMIVEFAGARMLNAGYGSTLAVWSAMIAVTMLSLAAGYFCGGALADRFPRASLLSGIILLGGMLVFACPSMKGLLKIFYELFGLRGGVLASSLAVFFVPLGLLGMCGPYVIRLLHEPGKGVGLTAGGVSAVSTLGSVAGTLLVGLWLIPTFGTGACLRATGIGLALFGALGVLVGTRSKAAALLLILPAAGLLAPATEAQSGLRYTAPDGESVEILSVRDSAHGRIAVLGKGEYLLLAVNGIVQTGIPRDLKSLRAGDMLNHYYFQELLPYMTDDPEGRSVLIIGLAGGMTATMLRDLYGMKIEAVDIDPAMIDIARRYFSFEGHAVAADGRRHIEDSRAKFDFCVIDVYSGDSMPIHLSSREAFQAVRNILLPGGVLAVNYIGSPDGMAFKAIMRTLETVFPHRRALRGEDSARAQTITIFASDQPLNIRKRWLDYGWRRPGRDIIGEAIARMTITPDTGGAPVLTDDHNPVDMLRADEGIDWRNRTIGRIGEAAVF